MKVSVSDLILQMTWIKTFHFFTQYTWFDPRPWQQGHVSSEIIPFYLVPLPWGWKKGTKSVTSSTPIHSNNGQTEYIHWIRYVLELHLTTLNCGQWTFYNSYEAFARNRSTLCPSVWQRMVFMLIRSSLHRKRLHDNFNCCDVTSFSSADFWSQKS